MRLALIFALSCAALPCVLTAAVSPIPLVPWDATFNDDMKSKSAMRIKAGGVDVPVGIWAPGGGGVNYCHFDCDGPVEVEFTFSRSKDLLADSNPGTRVMSNDRTRIIPAPADADKKVWKLTMNPGTKLYLGATRTYVCAGRLDPAEPKPGDPGVTSLAELGVAPGGEAAVTSGLQKAIDTVAAKTAGPAGRVLLVPPGVYLTGTLFMRDGVRLHLPAGAILRGAEAEGEWKWRKNPIYEATSAMIFFGNDVEKDGTIVGIKGASITGRGTIDGWGHWFRRDTVDGKKGNEPYFYEGDVTHRARLIMAMRSENCSVSGVTLRNPTFWTSHVLGCKKFDFSDLKVYSNYRVNGDGLNYDSCTDSTIDNCAMITGDDSHCLKNENISGINGPNERISMRNSLTNGWPKGVKFGWSFMKAVDCTYENNWLIGGSFSIALGRKYPAGVLPRVSEVSGLTLRNMRIDGDLDIALVGKLLESYKMQDVVFEDCVVGGKLLISNTTNLTFRRLTLGGVLITSLDQIKDQVKECVNVKVE